MRLLFNSKNFLPGLKISSPEKEKVKASAISPCNRENHQPRYSPPFEKTGASYCEVDDPYAAGNGSIMHLAPVPMFFAGNSEEAITRSEESSRTTHGARTCGEACRYFGALLVGALNGVDKEALLSDHYSPVLGNWEDHPLGNEIDEIASGSFKHKNPPQIIGSGYVVKSLEAALWAFHRSGSFKEGALLAVNLGNDADTIAPSFRAGRHVAGANGFLYQDVGQLQDAGNTTTLAHYLRLLESAFLASGLELFSQGFQRRRGSSPKLILWNNALVNALSTRTLGESLADPFWWGRLVENAVGGYLCNRLNSVEYTLTYWRERDQEVDFVVSRGRDVWAIAMKSGRSGKGSGLSRFRGRYPKARALMVGGSGIPLEKFFSKEPTAFLI